MLGDPLRNAAVPRGFERHSHVGWRRQDWLADDAVSCEPVSAANSLLTGKLTGNFAKSGRPPRFSCLMSARIQWLPAEFGNYLVHQLDNCPEFPTQLNREFPNAYQGIFFEEQGILIEGAAKPGEPQTPGVAASKLVYSLTAQIGPLSGAKRTLLGERVMSAPDPKRTLTGLKSRARVRT